MMTYDEMRAAIRREGIAVSGHAVLHLPDDPDAQWALLAPYVGQPLRAIPKGLVLLFTYSEGLGEQFGTMIRALPPAQRMVRAAQEEVFL